MSTQNLKARGEQSDLGNNKKIILELHFSAHEQILSTHLKLSELKKNRQIMNIFNLINTLVKENQEWEEPACTLRKAGLTEPWAFG